MKQKIMLLIICSIGIWTFHKTALGKKRQMELNIEKRINRSTFLNVTDINYEDDPLEKKMVNINLLDDY